MTAITTIFPPADSPLGLQSSAREVAALATSLANPPPFPDGALPRGEGETVLLIPGFLTGDWAMYRLRAFLSGLGYRVEFAGILLNTGPTAHLLHQVEETLSRLTQNGPINVIGQSFGGVLARGLVLRHPGTIKCLVTLGTPIRFPVITPLSPLAHLLAPFHEPDWLDMRDAIACVPGVAITAIYSEDDGYVDWHQCLQDEGPDCKNAKISGAHTTMASNPEAQIIIAKALKGQN